MRAAPEESLAFLRQALDDRSRARSGVRRGRSTSTSPTASFTATATGDALGYLERGLELVPPARLTPQRMGDARGDDAIRCYMLGRWDEALASAGEIPEDRLHDTVTLSVLSALTRDPHPSRQPGRGSSRPVAATAAESSDVQDEALVRRRRVRPCCMAEGRLEEALAAGLESLGSLQGRRDLGSRIQQVKQGWLHARRGSARARQARSRPRS